ncbi:Formate dehydrogenase, subunit A [Methanothrix harundinacea 6Ac]|uniref:Formate dehydrogenase, subunit A n=2 Tax=Methanothrix harundinacea TaxID=301375 RepID=G7WPV7_METH6|nr:Formate dehydrogenase, subunit A [Methanothrix harundinacea 6Ac]
MADDGLSPTVCPYCALGCGFYIRKGEGGPGIEYMLDHPTNEGALCPKGNAALEVLGHPERLRFPLLKAGDGWRRISWEEALARLAGEIKETIRDYGPGALGFLGSAKCTNEENYLFQKMARLLGSKNVDCCARRCHSPTIPALNRAFGAACMTNPISDLANSGCIFAIGSNFAENHPLVARWALRAKDRGGFIIVADPRLTPTAWLADLHLQINLGTDVALLNGMMNVIIEEGLYNSKFVEERTVGFEELADKVRWYTPERAAEITGVSASSILRAARIYARSPASAILYSMGITQHSHGTDNVTACADLALICGHLGRSGAGLYPLRGQNNVQGACDMGVLADFYPGSVSVSDAEGIRRLEVAWGGASLPKGMGMTAEAMPVAAGDGDLRLLYVMGEDIVNSDSASSRGRRELANLDFLAVQDIFMTETAEIADLVLPAAAWAEKAGSYTSTERRVQWSPRAIDPPGEARSDLSTIIRLANLLGLNFDYSGPEEVLAEIGRVVKSYAGITRERAGARGGVIWPCPFLDHPGTPILHQDGFSAPEGRARIFAVDYQPPAEERSQDYPLLLTTGRVVIHYNAGSMTRRSLSLMRRAPELFVEVNPGDADQWGVVDGDLVEVETRRGEAWARARVTTRQERGVLFMPFHFPETNTLTSDVIDPVARIPEFKVAACRIGKMKGV